MNIFDKREAILNLQESMLTSKVERNESFLSLISFENWCCNSGLSGFVQDYKESQLDFIEQFIREFGFSSIAGMVPVVRKYINQRGLNFIDSLTESEYDDLSQYDGAFFDVHDQFTDALYNKYISLG